MRVMLVTDTFPPQVNGVANSVNNLAIGLSDKGHSVTVCTVLAPRTHAAPGDFPFAIARTRSLPVPTYTDFRVAAPIGRSLGRAMDRFQPDIIHCHTPFSIGWQGVRAALSNRVPVLGTHHTLFGEYVDAYSKLGRDVNQRLATLIRRYVATFYNQCDLVSCASQYLAADLLSSGLERPVRIVPNPIDTDRFHPLPATSRSDQSSKGARLVYFGRLAPEKNLYHLISLVESVLRRHPDVVLDIVGDGPLMSNLVTFTRQRGLERQVRFMGWMRGAELATYVAGCDICVSASITENQPLSLLESLACGVPVVALAAAGVPEIIDHGTTGFLIDPAGGEGQFAKRLEQLLQDPALRRKMSRRAHDAAARYSHEACLKATLQTYSESIEQASQRSRRSSYQVQWLRSSKLAPSRLTRRIPRLRSSPRVRH